MSELEFSDMVWSYGEDKQKRDRLRRYIYQKWKDQGGEEAQKGDGRIL